jgi:hypothetical protein
MSDDETRRRVVRWIAANRFPFPGQTTWPTDYVTITNETERRQPIPTASGDAWPDIVIVDGRGVIREGGVVETDATDELAATWAAYAPAFDTTTHTGVRHFFVYVPEGLAERAQQLLAAHNVSYAGLRTWAVDDDEVRITPIVTPGDPQDHR